MEISYEKINLDEIEKELIKKVKPYYDNDCSGHSLDHAVRTMAIGKYIAQREGGDILIVSISCLVHDIFRKKELHTGISHFAQQSLSQIEEELRSLGFPSPKINRIMKCVSSHEDYESKSEDLDLETKILQDADRIDAIGAIGIARVFMFGGAYHVPLGQPEDSDRKYDPEKINSTIFAHFNDKLLKIKDKIYTETGKKIAEERHEFLLKFLNQLNKELDQIKRWYE